MYKRAWDNLCDRTITKQALIEVIEGTSALTKGYCGFSGEERRVLFERIETYGTLQNKERHLSSYFSNSEGVDYFQMAVFERHLQMQLFSGLNHPEERLSEYFWNHCGLKLEKRKNETFGYYLPGKFHLFQRNEAWSFPHNSDFILIWVISCKSTQASFAIHKPTKPYGLGPCMREADVKYAWLQTGALTIFKPGTTLTLENSNHPILAYVCRGKLDKHKIVVWA